MAQSSGSLQKKLKTALDETRLLLLGGQILLGFQFHGVFQESFGELSSLARGLDAVALLLMVTTLGLLIAPSMQHRIVEEGRTSQRIFRVTGYMAGAALLPFAISLGIDHYAVVERLFGPVAGYIAGAGFFVLALVFWYGLEYLVRRAKETPMPESEKEEHTSLSTKIEEMLTEARVVLPGAQALLGFQLAVTLTRAFEALPYTIEARARRGADAGGARGHSVDRSGCLSPHRVQRRGYRGVPPHRFLVHRRRDRPARRWHRRRRLPALHGSASSPGRA